MVKMIALLILILPSGIGRLRVLSILLSSVTSCIWFKADAEIAINRIPKLTNINFIEKWGLKMKYPVNPLRLTGSIIVNLLS